MTCRVILLESEEEFAVFCPALPGCVSQGDTESEAMEMILDAFTSLREIGAKLAPDGGAAEEAELLREAAADADVLTVRVREMDLAVAA